MENWPVVCTQFVFHLCSEDGRQISCEVCKFSCLHENFEACIIFVVI
jgi:hypothetical protein